MKFWSLDCARTKGAFRFFVCPKSPIKTLRRCSEVFVHLALVFLLLTLNKLITTGFIENSEQIQIIAILFQQVFLIDTSNFKYDFAFRKH